MSFDKASAFGKIAETQVSRRVLMGGALSAATITALAACSPTGGSTGGGAASKTATFGSGSSDDVPKRAYAAVVEAFQKQSGVEITTNTVAHNDFQNNINTYLQGAPDDMFTWFAGYRMRYYADKGLVAPIDDVWETIGGNYGEGLALASEAADGKKYFVPNYNYPWGFFYRKSVWAEKGYTEPTTFDELIALSKQMQSDGMTPIAFADKDGWPAMGTFDYINMRTNGYQFHVDLCAHEESWDQQKVKDVFDNWKQLLPFQSTNALGMTWQEGAQSLGDGSAGMYLLGSFVTQQFTDPAVLADIDFFPFPEIAVEGREAVEAPIDGLMLTKRGGENQAARDFLAFMGTAAGQEAYFSVDTANLMTVKDADTSSYTEFNKKLAGVISDAKSVSQFFDRDALPAMANNVMIPALQGFLKDGTIDTANLEAQATALYAAQ
ncbi:ABC transporter substrate-binding protein [Salinibacterium sp. G-O1]|uniref:ABC transporter substrate-binding protein n=1 Tax=Salinibacterium sp. G-O1 TaxID=3046208 RepID=UPI0024B88E4A|nr:ABC transporter substrate-binding protein [Salinibacterium sp. G-O1]MDJ0334329.1 ABC transporter substrate-binding protein [Salinibacterium sp. G-O1]